MSIREDEIKELKHTGGHVYGFEGPATLQRGITRRNRLIDNLVVGMVNAFMKIEDGKLPDSDDEIDLIYVQAIPSLAIKIADAVIAEGDK